jgi:mitosis inhibitor protein kinase SWE1
MASPWPAAYGIEGEGDREYIGPEILMGQYDKPADIFALGLIIFEIAGNVELPDNGPSWQKLRSGDLSDVPSLTSSTESSILRDASGNPLSEASISSFEEDLASTAASMDEGFSSHRRESRKRQQHLERSRRGEALFAPPFMMDPSDPQALDNIVRWMISPSPADRPVIDQVLGTVGVQWADNRRRAGATIFEGPWGPGDAVFEDTEMTDV